MPVEFEGTLQPIIAEAPHFQKAEGDYAPEVVKGHKVYPNNSISEDSTAYEKCTGTRERDE